MARMTKEEKLRKEVAEYKKKHGIPDKDAEENPQEQPCEEELTFWQQMIPYFLVIGAILISVCFLFTKQTGWFGAAVSGLFYGLFSLVSWVIPLLLVFLAIFWRKESFKRTMRSKFIVMGVIAVILSCGAFYMSVMVEGGDIPSMTPANIWKMAQKESGFKYGGIVGSYLGWIVFKAFSTVGTPIVLFSALVVMGIFLFDVKPMTAWIYTKRIAKYVWKKICQLFIFLYCKITKKETAKKKMYINKPGSISSELENDGFSRKTGSGSQGNTVDKNETDKNGNDVQLEKKGENPVRVTRGSRINASAPKELPAAEILEETTDYENVEENENKGDAKTEVIYSEDLAKLKKKGKTESGSVDLDRIFSEGKTRDNKNGERNTSAAALSNSDGVEKIVDVKENDDTQGGVSVVGYKDNKSGSARIYGADEENPDKEIEPEGMTVERAPLVKTVEKGKLIPKDEMYSFPPIEYLQARPEYENEEEFENECLATGKKLVDILKSFKVETRLVNISRGPTITRYELAPEEGVRVKSIAGLADDIALNLAANGAVRIEAPILGKAAVGVEIANTNRETVYLRELLDNPAFKNAKSKLTTALGLDVAGDPIYMDIAKMPHILIAGTTGAGKSVCINCLVLSLLYNATPDEVKLVMIDPKKVEFNIYKELPHLKFPIVTVPKNAAGTLVWAVEEMERRYDLIESVGVRDVAGYNEITKNDPEKEYLPKVVIVIDELADLMMTAPDSVETSICRIAQKGRASGMHLIIGTQRPSVDIITGLIKANIPSRIAFTVSSQVDSRTIIDVAGAEKLIGRGDMLYSPTGSVKPIRLQGAFVSDSEVDKITEFIREKNAPPVFDDDDLRKMEAHADSCVLKGGKKPSSTTDCQDSEDEDGNTAFSDPKFSEAVNLAIDEEKVSTSLLQRKLKLGYGRAAKIIDAMEALGIASAPDGQKARKILISREEWEEMRAGWSEEF